MSTHRVARPGLRIGEVARRTGITTATLRAWETRHGLLAPARTTGGQRLYREADITRVRAVRQLVAEGWSVAGAVSQVLGQPGEQKETTGPPTVDTREGKNQDGSKARGLGPSSRSGRPLLDALAAVDAYAVVAAYEAVRDLLRASEPGEVRDTLVGLVERLGGHVGEAALQDDTVIPVDLSFGEGPPLLPRAASTSVARMRLRPRHQGLRGVRLRGAGGVQPNLPGLSRLVSLKGHSFQAECHTERSPWVDDFGS